MYDVRIADTTASRSDVDSQIRVTIPDISCRD